MAKPPASPPSSDVTGVDRDARISLPDRDASQGTARELADKQDLNKGRPKEDSV